VSITSPTAFGTTPTPNPAAETAPAEQSRVAEFVARIQDRNTRQIMEYLLSQGISSEMLKEQYALSEDLDTAISDAAADLAAHVAASDPHTGYLKESDTTATSTASKVPIADGSGKLDTWITDATTAVKGKVQLATDGESAASKAVQSNDARMSNARTPSAHQFDGAVHTVSGLSAGHFLKATGATAFGFGAHGLTYSDVGAAAALSGTTNKLSKFATSTTIGDSGLSDDGTDIASARVRFYGAHNSGFTLEGKADVILKSTTTSVDIQHTDGTSRFKIDSSGNTLFKGVQATSEQLLKADSTGAPVTAGNAQAVGTLLGMHRSLSISYISGTGTSGDDNTAATTKSITLAGNTLTQVGDRMRIRSYWSGDTGTAITGTVKVNGVSVSHTTDTGGATLQLNEAWLHYIDNTHANVIENEAGALGNASAINASGFDWDSDQAIAFSQDAALNNRTILYALIVDIFPKGTA
jgi:hypothetical protein